MARFNSDRINALIQRAWTRLSPLLDKVQVAIERLPPPKILFEKISILQWPALFILGFLVADLGVNILGITWLKPPKNASRPPVQKIIREVPFVQSRSVYDEIVNKNPFCSDCPPIPEIEQSKTQQRKDCNKAKPLGGGLKLIGTIVLSNSKFSVATVSDGPEATALKEGDNFKTAGSVFEIRRNKVCFETSDGSLRYIDLPEESIKFGQPLSPAITSGSTQGISRISDTEVEVKRSFLTEKLADPQTLFQAQAVPERDESGAIKCFKVVSIVPGSVYESLGIQANDCISQVNGEPMNSITKAQELYASATTASEVSIEIIRGGQPLTQKFKVK